MYKRQPWTCAKLSIHNSSAEQTVCTHALPVTECTFSELPPTDPGDDTHHPLKAHPPVRLYAEGVSQSYTFRIELQSMRQYCTTDYCNAILYSAVRAVLALVEVRRISTCLPGALCTWVVEG